MTNLEAIAKHLLEQGADDQTIIQRLVLEYKTFKNLPNSTLEKMAEAVLLESRNTNNVIQTTINGHSSLAQQVINYIPANVSMGEGGVGCRGQGDFFVHSLLARLSKTSIKPYISPLSLDDTGAVKFRGKCAQFDDTHPLASKKGIQRENPNNPENLENQDNQEEIILTKMEGMHSRLSDFPFLAGFHVTRAALRDVYVKGGIPLSIMVDVHLADDGDIAKLFDFQAGIATVAEVSNVPITAGSTLRIGGDMVIGDRLTGGIAVVGQMKYSFFRKNIQNHDLILMTEGAGGGTIATTALYSHHPEVVEETINIKFLQASRTLFDHPEICAEIHSMVDVTNGGLRGDLYEINEECGLGVEVHPDKVGDLVNPTVRNLLHQTEVDFLGVSLDALLIYCTPQIAPKIIEVLRAENIKASVIGQVIPEKKVVFISASGEEQIQPRFRESAYTEIKKLVDGIPDSAEEMKQRIKDAYQSAVDKKEALVQYLQTQK